ncbi:MULTISPECIES: DUF1905 domain-containing protein [Hymenobacter]|uniref:Bacteriocin-protection, YdeI or OmpD-Associated n=1 Tax=Hymenobacter mucosus TaxID=1411120 RepID=A0A238VYU9_9BACT|nr:MULTISPECIES: YdeI/OmpD-associated family protein [Hymenobacter]SNR39408.1 Bacteriocin-protection, YdeI or OmpD-Associated [Hymenobacter mucosus]
MSDSPIRHEFDAELEMDGADSGVFLVVPFSIPETYGISGALPVQGTIDGFPIRLNLVPIGDGLHALPVKKEVRNAIGKSWSSTVHVSLERDTEERQLELPAELIDALEYAGLQEKFNELSFKRREEFANWIARAKKSDTRNERAQSVVQRLNSGQKIN